MNAAQKRLLKEAKLLIGIVADNDQSCMQDDAIDLLARIDAAREQPPLDWVLLSEQKPAKKQAVLLWDDRSNMHRIGDYWPADGSGHTREEFYTDTGFMAATQFTHWAPLLPPPPKAPT